MVQGVLQGHADELVPGAVGPGGEVVVPLLEGPVNADGLHGIEAAAAAGVVAGQAGLMLEVISQVTEEQRAEMRTYLAEHPVRVEFLDGDLVFDIQRTAGRSGSSGEW